LVFAEADRGEFKGVEVIGGGEADSRGKGIEFDLCPLDGEALWVANGAEDDGGIELGKEGRDAQEKDYKGFLKPGALITLASWDECCMNRME